MHIHADFSQRATVTPDQHEWVPSPMAGVERVMLDRIGEEKARATSLVRYAPDSHFPRHQHPGGEEIFVLSGTFSDEHGHYPAGWYVRNPPGSSHQPFSAPGATIFVKLWQMQPSEGGTVRVNTGDPAAWRHLAGRDMCPLFFDGTEHVCLQRLDPGDGLMANTENGVEVLVLAGDVVMQNTPYAKGSWIRLPACDAALISAGAQGATVYLKTGHLGRLTGAPAEA